jgi:ubiquilin
LQQLVEKERQEREGMNLTIKSTSGDKFPVTADAAITVADLKAIIQKLQDIPQDQQRLIYKGHVLKDDKTLAEYSIEEGHTIILVKGTKKPQDKQSATEAKTSTPTPTPIATPSPATSTPTPAPAAAAAANPFAGLMGNPMFGAAAGGGNMADMQRQLMENPEMMRSVMESPMMQSLLDNPELMQSLIQSNPQMRALMERNPEMAHVLNDPAIIRQSMEIARNPELMREMMRNTDRAMSNIEAHPEGFNALRRMYENIQEPMMDASSNSGNSGATATVVSPDEATDPNDAAPIPNPWAPAASGASPPASAASSNPASSMGALGGADLSALLGGMNANPANMNPDQMMEMMDNPFVQQMMRSMMSNPETMEAVSFHFIF